MLSNLEPTILIITISLVVLGFIVAVNYFLNKNASLKPIVSEFASALSLIIEEFSKKKPDENGDLTPDTTFDLVNKIAKVAVYCTEQISMSEELDSEQKKTMAMDYFLQITKKLNLPTDDSSRKMVQGCIESAVYFMNSINSKK